MVYLWPWQRQVGKKVQRPVVVVVVDSVVEKFVSIEAVQEEELWD